MASGHVRSVDTPPPTELRPPRQVQILDVSEEILVKDLAVKGDVLEHLLAAITEAGGLNGRDFERSAELVDD